MTTSGGCRKETLRAWPLCGLGTAQWEPCGLPGLCELKPLTAAMAAAWLYRITVPISIFLLFSCCAQPVPPSDQREVRVYQNVKPLMPPALWLDTSAEIDVLCNVLCRGAAQRRSVIDCGRKAVPDPAADASLPGRAHGNGTAAPQGAGGTGHSSGLSTAGCHIPCCGYSHAERRVLVISNQSEILI